MTVQILYNLTKELQQLLLQPTNEEKEQIIDEIEQILNQREEMIAELYPPFSKEETDLGQKLVLLDGEVNQLLQKKKMEIQADFVVFEQKKKNVAKYNDPYQTILIDGVFYDRKN